MVKPLKLIFERLKLTYMTYLNSTDEYWQNDFNVNFDSGKKISDFIGMIVRTVFAGLVIRYFFSKGIGAPAPDRRSFTAVVCTICLFLTIAIYFRLVQMIFNIIHSYFMSEITWRKSISWKINVIVTATYITLSINYGIYMLVSDFPTFKVSATDATETAKEKR